MIKLNTNCNKKDFAEYFIGIFMISELQFRRKLPMYYDVILSKITFYFIYLLALII